MVSVLLLWQPSRVAVPVILMIVVARAAATVRLLLAIASFFIDRDALDLGCSNLSCGCHG